MGLIAKGRCNLFDIASVGFASRDMGAALSPHFLYSLTLTPSEKDYSHYRSQFEAFTRSLARK